MLQFPTPTARRCWRLGQALRRAIESHHGVIFFMLEKLAAVTGVSNLHIYAAMRGQSLEEFQRTRNAPGALYSVAARSAGDPGWDQPRTCDR